MIIGHNVLTIMDDLTVTCTSVILHSKMDAETIMYNK